MPLDILEIMFQRINEYLNEKPRETIEVIWHGGEPLLLGADYFRNAVALQKRHCTETLPRIKHSIQTNLTCFNQSYVEPFRELGITSVGTSFDPEPHIRGPGKDIDSDYYNDKFLRGLIELERNGFGWGIIYVVTKKSLNKPLGVFYFLTNLVPSGGVMLNPVLIYDDHRRDISVSAQDYVEFLGRIFPVWWKHRHRYPNVDPFKPLVQNIIEGITSLGCSDSGSCTYEHINIAPNGETSQCGRSADWGLLQYGNVKERSLKEILLDSQRDELEYRNNYLLDNDCKGCRFWDLCHGGCPLDAYAKYKSFHHKSEWCEAKRGFITDYFEPVTGVHYEPKREARPQRRAALD